VYLEDDLRVHLIGIGGSGLSAIAQVLLERGVEVSGSDRQLSPLAARLQAAGAQVWVGHAPEHVQGADLVVRSSAITDDNPEVQAALTAGIPLLKRADFLGQLTAGRQTLAVAGTHGKTTTTAMLAWVLTELGLDPSYIIGGIALDLGGNAHSGLGAQFIVEADEYDGMFLGLAPWIAIVTNIEHDHPDCYPTSEEYYRAFGKFVGHLAPGGVLLACGEDPGALRLVQEISVTHSCRIYGVQEDDSSSGPAFDYRAAGLQVNEHGGTSFTMERRRAQTSAIAVSLQTPGEHNVRNALAVLAAADVLGLDLDRCAEALSLFSGTGRRFELRGEAWGVTLIDDYAHHPTEIRATLAAARRRYPDRPIWAVWQPHTFSRTRLLVDEFAAALSQAGIVEHVVVTGIYPAREAAPADGFSARQIVDLIQHPDVFYAPTLEQAKDRLLVELRPRDVVLVLSAGDADLLSAEVLRDLRERTSLTL
jgi:UDP-N-acetylmuramate--alanine ligase